LQQSGLADPGLALDHEGEAATAPRLFDTVRDLRELALALDEAHARQPTTRARKSLVVGAANPGVERIRALERWTSRMRGAMLIRLLVAAGLVLSAPGTAGAVVPDGNLLANPGAESGAAATDVVSSPAPPGWVRSARETEVSYTADPGLGFPGPAARDAIAGGTAFFAGGPWEPNAPQTERALEQSFDLTPYAAEIDRGNVRVRLAGAFGGYLTQDDNARLEATLASPSEALLTLQTDPVLAADRNDETQLVPRSASALVPVGVRELRVVLRLANADAGQTYNDGYADNLSVTLEDETPPIAQTTGVTDVTRSTARVTGTIDGYGRPTAWYLEYGESTAYGQRTADLTAPGAGGAAPVEAILNGLAADTAYHVRVVAVGPTGAVAGQDVTFRTALPDATAPASLPADLDFTWSPRADVQIAGAPAGGLQFSATPVPGLEYAWDFDHRPERGFQPDATVRGDAPRHAFTADGAHDTDRADGSDGLRRRVYVVRLRATAPDGRSAEVSHELVVMPNQAPLVDFTLRRANAGVSTPVGLRVAVSDPDEGDRTADRITRLEWDLDTALDGHPGDPDEIDLVCAPDGSACRLPDGGTPGPWFSIGPDGDATVDFHRRALAAHGLSPLGDIDLDALPATGPDGAPFSGSLKVRNWATVPFYVRHDPRVAYLYDTATLLQQSSFNRDAGEATGAQLKAGSRTRQAPGRIKLGLEAGSGILPRYLRWRQVTLTAVDSAGARSSITRSVPLHADQPPKLEARFVNRDPSGATPQQLRPLEAGSIRPRQAGGTKQKLDFPLTIADELAYDASSTADPDGRIAWYTLEVGTPFKERGTCERAGDPEVLVDPGLFKIPAPGELRPGQFFAPVIRGGTGPARPLGPVGSLPLKAPNRRAAEISQAKVLPTLAQLLADQPFTHPCVPFSSRNVVPTTFKVRATPAARPATRQAAIAGDLLRPGAGLEFDTTALVTRDARQLRFRIPVEGRYSVSVAAYDERGQGAIQRTDGFEIETDRAVCRNVSGRAFRLGGLTLGFSGLCMDFGNSARNYWTTKEINLNGVVIRPAAGAALFIDLAGRRLLATKARRPFLNGTVDADALERSPGGVSIVVDGDPIAEFDRFTTAVAQRWVRGEVQPAVGPTARYKGSPVARPDAGGADPEAFAARFETTSGESTTSFRIVLPREFNRGEDGAGPTSDITRRGINEPRSVTLTTKTYADIARAQKRRRARAAAINASGTIDLSNTTLGPVTIEEGRLRFDASKGYFEADVARAALYLPTRHEASLKLKIEGGRLAEASGAVGTRIPVFAGVFLTQVRFGIVTDPVTLSGGASFSALGGVLGGDVDLLVRTDPFLLRLTGSIAVVGVPLGNAYVQYDAANHDTLSFGGHLGFDLGPVSLDAGVDGGISFGLGEFYVLGQGKACLFICLTVKALVSNIAIAACGSIDIAFVEISAGFAIRFKEGLKVFTGCDLGPYVPAVFKTPAGARAAVASTGGVISVPAGVEQVALRFVGAAGSAGAPRITLTAPDGRVFRTAAAPGDYAFAGPAAVGPSGAGMAKLPGALVDQDPVDGVTSFLVVNPPAGDWRITPDPGQPPLRAVEMVTGGGINTSGLRAPVRTATAGATALRIGTQRFTLSGAKAAQKTAGRVAPARLRALRTLPRIEQRRLRGTVLDVPRGLRGELTLLDVGPRSTQVIETIDLAKRSGRVPVAFAPSDDPGVHELRAFLTHGDGTPRETVVVDRYTAPRLPAPSPPQLDVHRDSFGRTVVDVRPGTAGSPAGDAASFDLVVASSSGKRIERVVEADDLRALGGGRFRVVLGRFAATERLRVAGRMLYGNTEGRVDTDTLVRRG